MLLHRMVLAMLVMSAPAFAQQAPPRTSFGAPSLEGLWTNITATPLERPAAFDALTTTPERAAAFGKSSRENFLADNSDNIGGRQSEYWEVSTQMLRINGEIRTSIVVDPPNGKMPFNAEGKARLAKFQNAMLNIYDDPEARPGPERCLTGGSGATGAPMFTGRYNAHYQIVQTQTHILIAMEQNGVRRIIPLRPEPKAGPRRLAGHSIGRWDGDTLVVETQGFMPADAYKPAAPLYVSEDAKVTERFTRISPTEILYQFTVDDPTAFTQTWRGETIFSLTSARAYESACHEGNYSLPGILAGGRAIERRKAAQPGKKAGK
jgi:hypothetical protein